MLEKSTIQFLKNLGRNNNREWFLKNKKTFDQANIDFLNFTDELITSIAKFDKSISGLKAKDCAFRIYRDVRFSKDKSPYKKNFGASINAGGKKAMQAGYYIHVEPGNKSFLAGGSYLPPSDKLAAIRQEIDYHLTDFKKILNAPDFKKNFGSLSEDEGMKLRTAPKGYPGDHPAIELLKFKSFIISWRIKDEVILSKKFPSDAIEIFKSMKPLHDFLNRAME